MDIKSEKNRVREEILEKRRAIKPGENQELSNAIFRKVTSLLKLEGPKRVFTYFSILGEPETRTLIMYLMYHGYEVVIPKVRSIENGEMTLHIMRSFKEVEFGNFGIIEPKEGIEEVAPDSIDFAVIPGVAFDKDLNRIGFGKGFFDRLLKKLDCSKIGLAYDFQIVQNVPAEEHDEKVTCIVTPTTIYR